MQQLTPTTTSVLEQSSGGGLAELTALLREERSHMKEERELVEAKMERLQAKMERQRAEAEAQAKAFGASLAQQTHEAERHAQLAALPALQSQLESLHAAKLLTDEELYRLEDAIADGVEAEDGSGEQVAKLVALSGRVAGDAALARQLRRKFA